MKKQILVIHGGNAFETQEQYLQHLKAKEITLNRLRAKGWKDKLGEVLGQGYDVLTPHMPNNQNARYAEWKIWFEKIIPLLDEEVILIGHSLGGIFLAKYLSENNYPKRIKATFLVAAPFNTPTEHPLVDFILTTKLENFSKQGGKIFLYQSQDDHDVRFSNFQKYQQALPLAKTRIFEDKGHFNLEKFEEIIDDIRAL